jgi:hypothetical protein
MADNSPIPWQLTAQAMGITPAQQAKLLSAQQQEAMANALLQQGQSPISTEGRSIGGVGYKISPLEGLAKMADLVSGKYQQNDANAALANALAPDPNAPQQSSQQSDPIVAAMPPPTQALFNRLSLPESMGGSPRAAVELYGQYAAGMKGYNTGVGTAAAGNAPVGTLPPGVGQPPQQTPPPDAAAAYRQQNGMATPPIDTQRASMGLPIGSNVPMGNPPMGPGAAQIPPQAVPPMPASALGAPPAGGIPAPPPSASIPPQPPQAMPSPLPGETNNQFEARLAAAKAGQTKMAEAAGAGAASQAEDTGKNLADATKTFNVAASNLPRAMQRFSQLRDAAKNSSYGGGVSEEEPGSTFGDYARNYARTGAGQMFEPGRATANQIIDQATKQGVLSELGPQLAGLRGNKFLESIASGASGLNPADPAPTKINAINGLQDQYISNLKSLAQQRRQYGDPAAPSDMSLAQMIAQHASPDSMISVVDPQGNLGRVSAGHLPDLIQSGGQIR